MPPQSHSRSMTFTKKIRVEILCSYSLWWPELCLRPVEGFLSHATSLPLKPSSSRGRGCAKLFPEKNSIFSHPPNQPPWGGGAGGRSPYIDRPPEARLTMDGRYRVPLVADVWSIDHRCNVVYPLVIFKFTFFLKIFFSKKKISPTFRCD